MKDKTFENMIENWKQKQLEQISQVKYPGTNHCLNFERFASLDFTDQERSHIQSCSYCNKMVSLFSQYGQQPVASPIFVEKEPSLSEFPKMIINLTRQARIFAQSFDNLIAKIPLSIKLALPIFASIVIILILLKPAGPYSKIARIEYYNYQPINLRDGRFISETERIFIEGMDFYQKKDFKKTIQLLKKVLQKQPKNINGHFYLGLSYFYQKDAEAAIRHLNKVIDLNGKIFFEKCYWYLGNAYLLQEKPDKAVEMFEKVVEMGGDYQWEARELIEEIENIN